MRRITGWTLLTLGLIFIFLSPLVRLYVLPRVEKVPTDKYEQIPATGTGSYLQIKTFRYIGPAPLEDVQTVKSITAASNEDASVFDSIYDTKDQTRGETIDYVIERYVLDRRSSLPVHCCGETPKHEGYTLKLPFGTQKITYQWWDPTARRAFPARFVEETDLSGIRVYEFRSTADAVVIDPDVGLPGSYVKSSAPTFHAQLRYSVDTRIWVEPITGALIRGSQHAQRFFTRSDGERLAPASDTDLTWTDSYVSSIAKDTKKQADQLRMVQLWIPLLGPVIGLILIVVALLLLRRRPAPSRPAPAMKTAEQPAAG